MLSSDPFYFLSKVESRLLAKDKEGVWRSERRRYEITVSHTRRKRVT